MKLSVKRTFKRLLLITLIFCLTIVIINTKPFDEKLLPEVVELLLKEAPMPPIEGNAYFASLGLLEVKGQNMAQTGYQVIQYMIENNKKDIHHLTKEQQLEFFEINTDLDLFWQVPVITCEMQNNNDCLTKDYGDFYRPYYANGINQPRLQLLLQRFENILAMDTYQVYLDSGTFVDVLPYSSLRKLGEIQLINTYRNYSNHDFLQQLSKDINFWRMILTQGDFLLDKMVALSQIRKGVLFLSEFMRENEVAPNEMATITHILKSLPAKDKDLSPVFKLEALFMFKSVNALDQENSFFGNLLFQPNATNNNYYENNLRNQTQLSKLPLKEFIAMRQQKNISTVPSSFKFHYLYNFKGKKFLDYAGCSGCDDYIARVHDADNMIKLVGIQLQMKLDNDTTSILAKPENLNPYTDKPFIYNEKDSVIEFNCLDDFMDCKVRLH